MPVEEQGPAVCQLLRRLGYDVDPVVFDAWNRDQRRGVVAWVSFKFALGGKRGRVPALPECLRPFFREELYRIRREFVAKFSNTHCIGSVPGGFLGWHRCNQPIPVGETYCDGCKKRMIEEEEEDRK